MSTEKESFDEPIVKKQPFHKVILAAIKNQFPNDLNTLAEFLIHTSIPEDHDEIIAAWKNRTENVAFINQRVIKAILAEKLLAEERAKDRREPFHWSSPTK